jgi:hypothetical protein
MAPGSLLTPAAGGHQSSQKGHGPLTLAAREALLVIGQPAVESGVPLGLPRDQLEINAARH